MPGIFADSGYWIALWNPRDSLHERAEEIAQSIGATPVVTTQLALNKALDHMAGFFSNNNEVGFLLQTLGHSTESQINAFLASNPDALLAQEFARRDFNWEG